ncbi:MAG: transposase [Thermoleophilia bacterium]
MLCAWGVAETGERVLLSVSLGMRESEEDWISLGRDLTARGLPSSLLVVADGAPGLVSAIEQLWPRADRQRCTVHRVRNLLANVRTGQPARGACPATGNRLPRQPPTLQSLTQAVGDRSRVQSICAGTEDGRSYDCC